jgi:hypothetical protein
MVAQHQQQSGSNTVLQFHGEGLPGLRSRPLQALIDCDLKIFSKSKALHRAGARILLH